MRENVQKYILEFSIYGENDIPASQFKTSNVLKRIILVSKKTGRRDFKTIMFIDGT